MAPRFIDPRCRHTCTALAVALALAASPRLAHAQQPGSQQAGPQQAKLQEFAAHVKKAVQLKKKGQLRAALTEFQAARKIADHPKLAYAVGRIYEQIGDCATARAQYQAGIADGRGGDALQQKLNQALQANAQCADRGTLAVRCQPAGAKLFVDDKPAACPAKLEVGAGEHSLRAEAADRTPQTATVTVTPGGQVSREFVLGTPWQKTAVNYGKYGALGVGGALLLGGIWSDLSTTSLQDEMARASRNGNVARTNELSAEADSAHTRTGILYGLGAIFAAGGVALWIYQVETTKDDGSTVQAAVNAGPDGASVSATVHW